MTLVQQHMSRFGLEMHAGKIVRGETKPSKIECIFFPPPQFSANLNPLLENSILIENIIAEEGASSKDQDDALQEAREIARTAQEDDLYNQLDETQQFDVTNGFITFCKHSNIWDHSYHIIFAMTTILKCALPLPISQWVPYETSGTTLMLTCTASS